ncbi:hypothetical protein [Sediminibacillus albus]|uniref:hypothetical protein n=1 Tax=Sediminibacillus albus TaxID=407036 RepID=UPI0015880F36|nr:hypothetical protein [Sediminibacillus albus]
MDGTGGDKGNTERSDDVDLSYKGAGSLVVVGCTELDRLKAEDNRSSTYVI